MKITKRDVLFFCIGVVAMFVLEVVYDWDDHKKAFDEGYKKGYSSSKK
ncbi:hypothetical protein [uncultured Imperialibacter sp.]|tara:strand:+ start:4630 stop:4773 length:144 start_codon:yes stop_codon:yes gene_type:complete